MLATEAVRRFWEAREAQASKQRNSPNPDHGFRGAVTGGAQMNGFVRALQELATMAGVPPSAVYTKSRFLELPGYFRPTKEWDFVIVFEGVLLAAIEAKSQVGPSFGNNFNNRTEEAMGSALDLWTAFREKAYKHAVRPWLGYTCLCWRTVLDLKGFCLCGNRTLRFSQNTAMHRMPRGTKSSARSSSWKDTMMPPCSCCPREMKACSGITRNRAKT